MKKTRFEKFMRATTARAMKEESLDTFSDHLNYTLLSIQMELLKVGQPEKPESESLGEETGEARSRVDQISGALGTIKRGLVWSGSGLKKIYNYLITGNNFVIVMIGLMCAYVAIITALEMI